MLNLASFHLPENEIDFKAVRAQGPGGQNVNKLATAIQLRFDISASSLPDAVKQRLLMTADSRISNDGVLVIKAQSHRTQERNRAEALERLELLLESVRRAPKARKKTRPSKAAKAKRVDEKKKRGELKKARAKPY
ncbi:aminoacyl-tRNA hydrolase [Marinihelvus fidelis]|uniref:Aminoacyl-tRNA hydrolase n=1 Tax=Marinihelvus fidelis TaxID=2613842 RepID=A0A5N0TJ00_9GAMM|nr:alternative ribosome rescue aminoacyl-tRNA hydrolase ArfB [Marinihelvus fidelis]KAA9134077.1 aminoacyl-tRNA hydrolase [Marinihelvus fidelis]